MHRHPGRSGAIRRLGLIEPALVIEQLCEYEGGAAVAQVDPDAIDRLGFVEPALLLEQVSEIEGGVVTSPRSIPMRYAASASSSRPCSLEQDIRDRVAASPVAQVRSAVR